MAKGKNTSNRGSANNNSIATRRVSASSLGPIDFVSSPLNLIDQLEAGQHDRRQWNPTSATSGPASTNRKATRLNVDKFAGLRQSRLPWRLEYATPRNIPICVRRKIRRQVLLALGNTGGGRGKRKRRNLYSGIKC